MKYALVIVEAKNTSPAELDLRNLAKSIEDAVPQTEAIERLNAGAYVLNLAHGLHALAILEHLAEGRGLAFRTLFFDQVPSFVVTKPAT